MSFISASVPLASYRRGNTDEAIEIAGKVLALDPNAAEAHLCLGLIAFRKGEAAAAMDAFRKCTVSRSGEWVLERVRDDFARWGIPAMGRDIAMRFGGFLRSNLSPLGPVLPSDLRRADHSYVNVVGTSYVRSFGGNPAFFPLFIGMGPTMLLLTEETAAVSRRKFHENLKRLDPARDTVLVLNGDTYYHATNLLKIRTSDSPHATADDLALMDSVAQRHEPILLDARKQITGRVMLLGATPSYSPLMDQLSAHLNQRLKAVCERVGVDFLDWWDHLADPVTQHLHAKHSANAYPGDVHFSLATTELFMSLLKDDGVFGPDIVPSYDFDWTHVFECEIDKSERTRIWCEPGVTPNNAFKSNKIASSHLGQRAADLLCCLAAQKAEQTFAMVNVRDGHTPISLPPQVHSGCVALTDSLPNRRVAQMVLDFYGRADVQLRLCDDEALADLTGAAFTYLILIIHPDTASDDEHRCNEVLARIGPCPNVIIMTPLPERLAQLRLNGRSVATQIAISNRHVPEVWHQYTVAIAR
ncbi:MAG: hypothetical protein KBC34_13290 [Phenylobacterium sp.]|nr:hypothetical protein [Phenylobacterium sp.]